MINTERIAKRQDSADVALNIRGLPGMVRYADKSYALYEIIRSLMRVFFCGVSCIETSAKEYCCRLYNVMPRYFLKMANCEVALINFQGNTRFS